MFARSFDINETWLLYGIGNPFGFESPLTSGGNGVENVAEKGNILFTTIRAFAGSTLGAGTDEDLSFFSIPGLGSYTIEAINNQDYGIVRAMVFLGSILYIVGLILTDIAYTLVDPRVRLD